MIYVEIKIEHMRLGRRNDCAIALAIKEAIPKARAVEVQFTLTDISSTPLWRNS